MSRVAVLGGTLSGQALARRLAEKEKVGKLKIELFRNLFDPARSIHTPHALCEYQAATFVLRPDMPEEFTDEVRGWEKQNLVEKAPDFRVGHANSRGEIRPVLETKGEEGAAIRYRAKRGFLGLVDDLIKRLPKSVQIRPEQLGKMYAPEKPGAGWWLEDIQGKSFGPYDHVLLAFDQNPRAARKASMKQLLESALPTTGPVIAAAGHAVQASGMAAVVHFDPPVNVPWDSLVVENIPELRMAARNPKDGQAFRNLKQKNDTWTLVATPAWTKQTRPTHTTPGWDKNRVGRQLVAAFGKVCGVNTQNHRLVIPTFHWQGATGLTRVRPDSGFLPCAYDAETGLGWCGDIFGGIGVSGAVTSGAALASLVGGSDSNLPMGTTAAAGGGAWELRPADPVDDDIAAISGPDTGRQEPQEGLDQTWPTAAQLAKGFKVDSADSLARYRPRNVLAQDQSRLQSRGSSGTPTTAANKGSTTAVDADEEEKRRKRAERFGTGGGSDASPAAGVSAGSEAAAAAQSSSRKRKAAVAECVDKQGLVKVAGVLDETLQAKLLAGVFPVGTSGVCGGLYDPKTGTLDTGDEGDRWAPLTAPEKTSSGNGFEASWADLGMHGNHCVDWEKVDGEGAAKEALATIQQAVKDGYPRMETGLATFNPDSVYVAFESMKGRSINPKAKAKSFQCRDKTAQTVCGWSSDGDYCGGGDKAPKVWLMLGRAKVTVSFKYSKQDWEALDVVLNPGDALVLFGDARSSWVRAVTGVELNSPTTSASPSTPFDMVNVYFSDHRQLKRAKADKYARMHDPSRPNSSDFEYRWMQYLYTVVGDGGDAATSGRRVVLKGEGSGTQVVEASKASSPREGGKGKGKGSGYSFYEGEKQKQQGGGGGSRWGKKAGGAWSAPDALIGA